MWIGEMYIGLSEAAALSSVLLGGLLLGFGIGALTITWLHRGLYK